MRMIVSSWMCEVAAEFRLQQETLFLAVALLDRFLSASKVRARAEGAVVLHAQHCRWRGAAGWRAGALTAAASTCWLVAAPSIFLSHPRRACRAQCCSWWRWHASSWLLSRRR